MAGNPGQRRGSPCCCVALRFAVLLFLALFAAACGDDETRPGNCERPPRHRRPGGGRAEGEEPDAGAEGETEEEREREEQEAREAGGKDARRSATSTASRSTSRRRRDVLDGANVYESEGPFGKTERFFAAVDGDAGETARDARRRAERTRQKSGYKILATDEEENTEAEAHLEGTSKPSTSRSITLCEGKLRIRYTVS